MSLLPVIPSLVFLDLLCLKLDGPHFMYIYVAFIYCPSRAQNECRCPAFVCVDTLTDLLQIYLHLN